MRRTHRPAAEVRQADGAHRHHFRVREAAEFAERCKECVDKSDCDARKLVVVCPDCARTYRVNGTLMDEPGMMGVLLDETRHNLEESIDFLATYWKEEGDIDLTGFGPYYGDAWSDLADFERSFWMRAELAGRDGHLQAPGDLGIQRDRAARIDLVEHRPAHPLCIAVPIQ